MKVWREANQKPPLGAVVDWSHPRAQGLVCNLLLNEGCGALVADGGVVDSTALWCPGGVYSSPTVNGGVVLPPRAETAYTLTCILTDITSPPNTATIIDAETGRWIWRINPSIVYYDGVYRSTDVSYPTDGKRHILTAAVANNLVDTYLDGTIIKAGLTVTSRALGGTVRLGCRYTRDQADCTLNGTIEHWMYHVRVLTSAEIIDIHERPYEGYLVPGLARIFDMGAGGVPIGAIRTRFPALTGGLRI